MDRRSRFVVMLVMETQAILLSAVILVYFASKRHTGSEPQNQGWLILLVINFFQLFLDLPLPMSYYYLNYIWPATNAYCAWWTWCEFSLNSVGLFLMAWISIERHLFVFHSQAALQGRWKRWTFHYLPIAFCLLWPPLFFLVVVVISPLCTTVWDFNTFICGFPCYYVEKFYNQFDFIFNLAVPVVIIMLANVTLVLRVIYRKLARQQVIQWRRHRKMVLQLWIVSSLYMAFWLPVTLTLLIQNTVLPTFMLDQLEVMQFFVYFIPLLLPMICLSILPELMKKIKNFIRRSPLNVIGLANNNQHGRQVVPITAGR